MPLIWGTLLMIYSRELGPYPSVPASGRGGALQKEFSHGRGLPPSLRITWDCKSFGGLSPEPNEDR